ncbi:hypothetical protein Tco_0227409 [Tanacetum coccineum]
MGVIMELHEGECVWPATQGVVKEDESNDEEGKEYERELFEIGEVGVVLVVEEKVVKEEDHDFVSKVREWPFGKAWYWRMKILRSVLFRKERMAGPKENRVKVAEKEETGKFRDSPYGGPVNLRRSHIY